MTALDLIKYLVIILFPLKNLPVQKDLVSTQGRNSAKLPQISFQEEVCLLWLFIVIGEPLI